MKIDLRALSREREFRYEWTDLVNSSVSSKGKVRGGSVVEIKCPEDYPAFVNFKDWLLYLKSTD